MRYLIVVALANGRRQCHYLSADDRWQSGGTMPTKTSSSTRQDAYDRQSQAGKDYDRLLDALNAALGDSQLVNQLDEAVGARLAEAEDEILSASLENQVAAPRSEVAELRCLLA